MIIDLSQTREDIGRNNRSLVLSEILFHGPIPRSHIASRVGLTQASVSRITRQLLDAGLIQEDEAIEQDGPGRRFIGLKVRPTGCFIAGISINVFRQDIVICDLSNAEVASRRLKLENFDSGFDALSQSARELNELIDETGIDRNRLVGCGVTVSGAIDPENGLIRSAPLLGWQQVDILKAVKPWLDIPVFVDNIPNAKNLTAHGFGPAKGLKNVALLNVSLATGCSLMLDGHLLRGRDFNVGLIDSLLVPSNENDRLVSIDNVAGGFAVTRSLLNLDQTSGRQAASQLVLIMEQARNGDQQASQSLYQAGHALSFAVANMNALLHPELVLLSGPMIESEDYCRGVRENCNTLLGTDFVASRLRCASISNQEAACAMATFRLLAMGEVSNQIAIQNRSRN